ncbi:MAG: DUF5683 domain-containing protein [Candidatus Zixiibacteriota bacterium]
MKRLKPRFHIKRGFCILGMSFYCENIKDLIYFPEINQKGNLFMNQAIKWNLAVCCVLCLVTSTSLLAQDEGNVVINSNPQGGLVRLEGLFDLSGVTPIRFDRVLSGQYRLTVERDGYEKYKSTEYFSETQPARLDINLVKKTRTKAFFRSIVFPGWGQKYYGDKTKSTVIALGTLASVVGYIHYKSDYDDKVEDFNAAKQAFADERSWSKLGGLEERVWAAQRVANDAENKVNLLIAVTAGVYLLNLLDTILLFPEHSSYSEYKSITAVPDVGDDKVGLTLAVRF